jgi:hypothetical protein
MTPYKFIDKQSVWVLRLAFCCVAARSVPDGTQLHIVLGSLVLCAHVGRPSKIGWFLSLARAPFPFGSESRDRLRK